MYEPLSYLVCINWMKTQRPNWHTYLGVYRGTTKSPMTLTRLLDFCDCDSGCRRRSNYRYRIAGQCAPLSLTAGHWRGTWSPAVARCIPPSLLFCAGDIGNCNWKCAFSTSMGVQLAPTISISRGYARHACTRPAI